MANKKRSKKPRRVHPQQRSRDAEPKPHEDPPLARALGRAALWLLWSLAIGVGFLIVGTFNTNADGSLGFAVPGLFFSAFGIAAPSCLGILAWAISAFWGDGEGGWRRRVGAADIGIGVMATIAYLSITLLMLLLPVAALTEVDPDILGRFGPFAVPLAIGLLAAPFAFGTAAGAVHLAGWWAALLGVPAGAMVVGFGMSAVSSDPLWQAMGFLSAAIWAGGLFGVGMPYLIASGQVRNLRTMWALFPVGLAAMALGHALSDWPIFLAGVVAFSGWIGFMLWRRTV